MDAYVVVKLNKVKQILGVQAVMFDKKDADKIVKEKNTMDKEVYEVHEAPVIGLPGTKLTSKDMKALKEEEPKE